MVGSTGAGGLGEPHTKRGGVHLLRIAYYQSTIEGCARPGNEELRVDGNDIIATVTLMQPPPTKWSIPCHEQVVELDTILPIQASLEPGQSYRVIVNDRVTGAFSLPRPELEGDCPCRITN